MNDVRLGNRRGRIMISSVGAAGMGLGIMVWGLADLFVAHPPQVTTTQIIMVDKDGRFDRQVGPQPVHADPNALVSFPVPSARVTDMSTCLLKSQEISSRHGGEDEHAAFRADLQACRETFSAKSDVSVSRDSGEQSDILALLKAQSLMMENQQRLQQYQSALVSIIPQISENRQDVGKSGISASSWQELRGKGLSVPSGSQENKDQAFWDSIMNLSQTGKDTKFLEAYNTVLSSPHSENRRQSLVHSDWAFTAILRVLDFSFANIEKTMNPDVDNPMNPNFTPSAYMQLTRIIKDRGWSREVTDRKLVLSAALKDVPVVESVDAEHGVAVYTALFNVSLASPSSVRMETLKLSFYVKDGDLSSTANNSYNSKVIYNIQSR